MNEQVLLDRYDPLQKQLTKHAMERVLEFVVEVCEQVPPQSRSVLLIEEWTESHLTRFIFKEVQLKRILSDGATVAEVKPQIRELLKAIADCDENTFIPAVYRHKVEGWGRFLGCPRSDAKRALAQVQQPELLPPAKLEGSEDV